MAEKMREYVEDLRRTLMTVPAEFPAIEELVDPAALAEYQRLDAASRELFWVSIGSSYGRGLTSGRGEFPALTKDQEREYFSSVVHSFVEAGFVSAQ